MARSAPVPFRIPGEMRVFWFLLIAMVVVVAAVTLAVVGGGDGEGVGEGVGEGLGHSDGGDGTVLPDVAPERLTDPLPEDRPVRRSDIEELRLPMVVRGYRMADVDDVLSRLGAELAERDVRIAELETALAGARAGSVPDEKPRS
jgi:DivIVA domain-containing protein